MYTVKDKTETYLNQVNINKKKLLELLSLKVLGVACLFVASLFVFAFIAHEAVYENEDLFDNKVFSFLSSYSTDGLLNIMQIFTFFGSVQFLMPAYIILILYFLIRKKFRYCIDILIVSLSSTGLMFGLKQFFHRARPDLPLIKSLTSYSFPSGHALSSFILSSILIYLIWDGDLKATWKWLFSILLVLFSVTIGISRIVLKVHYATDVIAGFCLGIVWGIMSFWWLKKITLLKPSLNKSAIEDGIKNN